MNRYDPEHALNPEQWLALDEQVRVDLAEEHHRIARIKLPNLQAHATLHAIVENQIAQNLESVVRAMTRLTAGGQPSVNSPMSAILKRIYKVEGRLWVGLSPSIKIKK